MFIKRAGHWTGSFLFDKNLIKNTVRQGGDECRTKDHIKSSVLKFLRPLKYLSSRLVSLWHSILS